MTRAQRTSAGISFVLLIGLGVGILVWQLSPTGIEEKAQGQDEEPAPTDVTKLSYEQLKEHDVASVNAGASKTDRAKDFAAWMGKNPWKSLSLSNQRILYDRLDPDQIDFRSLSIRWTGTIIAPKTDSYTFSQMRQHEHDGTMKVTVGGNVVLDSTRLENRGDERFSSQPLRLTAGQAVPIQVDYSHKSPEQVDYSRGSPLAVLAWKTAGNPAELIPEDSYAPPTEFDAGQRGLKAEVFAGPDFEGSPKAVRLEPGVEMTFSWGPVVPVYKSEVESIRNEALLKLSADSYLSNLNGDAAQDFLNNACWQLSHRLPVSKRKMLVDKLLAHRGLLPQMSTYAMGKLMESIYMLPGKEHLELLTAWSLAQPQPKTQIGIYPGWAPGSYRTQNSDFYWLMGFFLQEPYFSDVELLLDEHLRRPDGECNLIIAYATAFSARYSRKHREFLARVQAGIDDQDLNGDQKMTWLLARAFAKEALVQGEPRPMRGIALLHQAMETATSNENRFWALQELVARYASLDKADNAKELMDQYQNEFNSTQQIAVMNTWRAKSEELRAHYVELRKEPNYESLRGYISMLEERINRTQGNGDAQETAKYQQLLASAKSRLPND